MTTVRVQQRAAHRLDEIFRYTRDRWGDDQAEEYITGLFRLLRQDCDPWRRIKTHSAEFGVEGFFFRHERHFVYWRIS